MVAKPLTLRGWATPLTIGAFFLMAGTGTVMFFKFDNGLMAVVHRWCSWIFMAGAISHITANIRPFKNHLASPLGRTSAVTFLALLLVSFFSWGQVTNPKLIQPIETALVEAPIGTLASVVRSSPEDMVARFREAGIVATPDQSIHVIAIANHTSEGRLLGMVFLPGRFGRKSEL